MKLAVKVFLCSFLKEKITISHIPSVYTVNATYLGLLLDQRQVLYPSKAMSQTLS